MTIRVIDAPAFIATKFEAFSDRGRRDVAASHDLEDILNIVDGRVELAGEIAEAEEDLRDFVISEMRRLLDHPTFRNVLPGLVVDSQRADAVLERLERIAQIDA